MLKYMYSGKYPGRLNMTFNQAFAVRVREVLRQKKMTQYRLEQQTGIYHSSMTNILNNTVKASNVRSIAIIIRELGMTMTEFFDSPVFNFDNLDID